MAYYNDVINYPFIDYIIKAYVPDLQLDEKKYNKVDMNLFKEAMLHTTTKFQEHHKTYQRLEYLGDCFYHLIITEYLFQRYDEENSGFMTRLRIRIERGDSMVELTKILGLDKYIQIYGISINDHILEDVFEAFIGAFYLSFGIKYTKILIINLIEKHKNLSEMIFYDDNYKDLLLQYYHQMKWGPPIYEDGQYNMPNNGKKFKSIVKNPFDKKLGEGTANRRDKAEQLASKNALIALGVIVNGEKDPNWIDKIEKEIKEKEIDKSGKKTMSVFNPNNKLLKCKNIMDILLLYNVVMPKNYKIDVKPFYEAMTHRSYLVRKKLSDEDIIASKNAVKLQKKSNERLKFMGDAVIHFVIGEFLYFKYPYADEGFLTRLRCKLEKRESLYYLAKQTGISDYLLVSQNIEILHGRNNVNIIGSGFEAFVGALYLQFGLFVCKQLITEIIRIELDITEIAENETNYKDLILQLYNKNHWGRPIYKVIKEDGPDHQKKFTIGIYLNGKSMGLGTASSKRKAEQIASKKMYDMYTKDN